MLMTQQLPRSSQCFSLLNAILFLVTQTREFGLISNTADTLQLISLLVLITCLQENLVAFQGEVTTYSLLGVRGLPVRVPKFKLSRKIIKLLEDLDLTPSINSSLHPPPPPPTRTHAHTQERERGRGQGRGGVNLFPLWQLVMELRL